MFAAAIAIADPKVRALFLEHECDGKPELRQRTDQLCDAHFRANPLLDQAPTAAVQHANFVADNTAGLTASLRSPVETAWKVIAGRYKLLQQIGEGGMGSVWMAGQTEPVKRRVAVKLIRVDRGNSKTILSRFEAERQAIALKDHPNIAKLLDARTADVLDTMVSEVTGDSLTPCHLTARRTLWQYECGTTLRVVILSNIPLGILKNVSGSFPRSDAERRSSFST